MPAVVGRSSFQRKLQSHFRSPRLRVQIFGACARAECARGRYWDPKPCDTGKPPAFVPVAAPAPSK